MQAPFPATSPANERALRQLEQLGHWMDRRYVDPILGLVMPGVGDALGALVGLYGVNVAFRIGAHPMVIARMLVNLALDAMLGAIPVLGALGDFFFRAHSKNAALLRARRDDRVRPTDYVVVGAAALGFAVALVLPIVLAAWLLTWAIQALGS